MLQRKNLRQDLSPRDFKRRGGPNSIKHIRRYKTVVDMCASCHCHLRGTSVMLCNMKNASLNGVLRKDIQVEWPEGFFDTSRLLHFCKLK